MPKLKRNRPMYLGYDKCCGWCQSNMEHTCFDHDKAVSETKRKNSLREDALYRQARRQYDAP